MDYQVVPHQVQLHEVVMEKLNCGVTGEFDPAAKGNVKYSVKVKGLSKIEAYGFLSVQISFEEKGKNFSLQMKIRGKFINHDPDSPVDIKAFVRGSSLHLLLPWVRETIACVTRQMGFPPLLLPLIDVNQTLQLNQ